MIPNRLIFIWIGPDFPWSGGMAILSAYNKQKPQSIWLFHEGATQEGDGWNLIKDIPSLDIFPIEDSIFEGLNDDGICLQLFKTLDDPIIRSNLLRLALLYKYGGVYMDSDVIMVKPIHDLLDVPGFVGLESKAFPTFLFKRINPFHWFFSNLKFGFSASISNAIVGAEPGNETFHNVFQFIKKNQHNKHLKDYLQGARLLQTVSQNKTSPSLFVLPPQYFYPLGPKVCSLWFNPKSKDNVEKFLPEETRVVHWYRSINRDISREFSEEWAKDHPTTAFSNLIEQAMNPADSLNSQI